MNTEKSKINFKDYEPVGCLDQEEQELFHHLQEGGYQSVMTDELKAKYVAIFADKNSLYLDPQVFQLD